jgi:hypothetical protein
VYVHACAMQNLLEGYGSLAEDGLWVEPLRTHCVATFTSVEEVL